MTVAALRVPRIPPAGSPKAWAKLGFPAFGWTEIPRAVHYNGVVYIGFVDSDGGIRVGAYNESSQSWTVSPAIATGFVDWHDAPDVLVRTSDHKLVISYSAHGGSQCFIAISTNAQDVSAWGAATDISATLGPTNYTYPSLIQLSGESGKIYLIWRVSPSTTASWWYATSTNGGSTWSAGTELYACPTGKRGYLTFDTDSVSRIDFVCGDASATFDTAGNAYHFYYDSGSYHKSDGTLISSSLPLAPTDLTELYDGSTSPLYFASSVVTNGSTPYLTFFTADPSGFSSGPDQFWYASYSGGWSVHQVDVDGAPHPADGIAGGISADPGDRTVVYVQKVASGFYHTWKYVTGDGGSTWSTTQITDDSDALKGDFELKIVRGSGVLKAIWLYGQVTDTTTLPNETSAIRGYPNPISAF